MAYTRIPALSGAGAIVSVPSNAHPIPISDPSTTWYHQIPGTNVINNLPPAALVPTMVVSDASQSSGTYIVGDDIAFVVTVPDTTDSITTTGVNIYESGVLQGAANLSFPNTWIYTALAVTAGAKSYVARRVYTGGTVDSAASTLTVQDLKAPNQFTSISPAAWWRNPDSIQYGGTPLKTAGTGTNAVTLTGTLSNQPYGWELRIPVGGARGTATYAISHDNNATNAQTGTTAATVVDGSTGITVNFPTTSNYFTNDVYKAVINPWNDKIGANNAANATSGQRPFPIVNVVNGVTASRYDTNDVHNITTSLANDIAGGTNVAHTVAFFVRVANLPAGAATATIYRLGATGSLQCGSELRILGGTTAVWEILRRDSAGNTRTIDSNIPATLGVHLCLLRFNGTNVNVRIDGVDVIGGSSDVSGLFTTAASITLNNMSIGAQVSSAGTASFFNGDIFEGWASTGYLSDVETIEHERYY